ncbi:type I polyketide synthase [Vitiosangium sp. GDMCC 1.1324]|uniref:type I polyketide synthase n=1 Tax=Vitiosangium sp. (strain GDMCC 1.1324) TaxID=2138576 RepID=UPI000D35D540|nr:type I polyketide synthase [Vitiosangium sp. GDMCC 1.1324]PTL75145.1 polyketide synthase [Vitiosangium sp. GDMCC 1.1324]
MPPETFIDEQDIAIIGMTGRFPGAKDLDAFWKNLCNGTESIRPLSDADLEKLGVDPALRKDPHYVKASAALEGMELFDAGFFGFTPREAELMDPQHRVFLECAWEALERAGYTPDRYDGAIGVFAGASTNTYLIYNLVPNADRLGALDQVQIDVGNGGDFLSTRVAYKLDLRGPSYSILSACSTSLVATHVACQSLLNQECDMALAGGVSVHVKHPEGYSYIPGGIVSPDGHCRAFDAKAEGTVFGSGVGAVVLKRLKDALKDGDHIHAIIKGSAINNDGSHKVGYTAPSVEGQAAVIDEALGAAGVEPETIGYIEAHGTGTQMGDPIELRALTKAFRYKPGTPRAAKMRCAVGSLKSNIGHLANAAGVSSLIKAVLSLEHQKLTPSLHFEKPSPEIDFANSPFYVNTTLADWKAPANGPRRAGVSSFGVGGTNAHVVLQEAPPLAPSSTSRPVQLLVLSAKSEAALEVATDNLARHLKENPGVHLPDVAHTLQVGRQAMAFRRVVVSRDREEAVRALETRDPQRVWTGSPTAQDRPVAFLFPGQGSQYVDMARELYASEPVFCAHLDSCATLLLPHLGVDLRKLLYPEQAQAENAAQALTRTAIAQPALFSIEYALAQLWMSWGVQPKAMLGHSIGEYVAACLAGVFELRDALALVAARGRMMQELPAGSMLSVVLPEDELRPHLGSELSVAAVNAPSFTVVAGPTPAIEALQEKLKERGVNVQRLHTSHAFHSAMMDPILAPFTARVRQVKLNPPKIPFVSNVTGTWIEASQATDPSYWATHLRQAVRFADGLKTLAQKPQQVLLEVGPGNSLASLTRQQGAQGERVVLSSTRHPREQSSDEAVLLSTLGRLWLSGVTPDWSGFYAREKRRRLPLPTYPFERQRYWLDARPGSLAPRPAASAEKKKDIADWFYVPSWKRTPIPRTAQAQGAKGSGRGWLVFADAAGVADALAPKLAQAGQSVIRVVPGDAFGRLADGTYTLHPQRREDYAALLQALQTQGQAFDGVVHLWSVTSEPVSLERALDTGFYSQLFLAQALGTQKRSEPLAWWVASNGAVKVESTDVPSPEKATLLGPCRVVPQEYPHITCHFVDVAPGQAGGAESVAAQLFAELQAGTSEPVIAWRGRQRWVQTFEPVRLEADAAPLRTLKEQGVYLVTEGLTGIGHALARELARTSRARLVLVEGKEFPAKDQWAQWLSTRGPQDAIRQKIQAAQALEATGASVLVLGADLTDEAGMRQVLSRTVEHFGRIDGVIHAAGGLRQGSSLGIIQDTGPSECASHFAPQVHGLRVLEKVLPAEGPAFCLLVSSLSSILGGLGQVVHAAASQFMDTFAERRSESGSFPWLSVDWDAWQFEEAPSMSAMSPALAQFAIQPQEGLEVIRRILTQAPGGQLVMSTGDLEARRRQGPRASTASEKKAATSNHARPSLATAYVAPRNDLERSVASVWQQVLGIEQIGVNDNFFELGGHSLLATQLRNQLHAELKVDLPLRGLFETPTVAATAAKLEQELAKNAAAAEKPIGERLRAAFPTERQGIMEDYLKRKIAHGLRIAMEQFPADGSLKSYDLRLLGAEVEYNLRQDFKFQLYPHEIQEHASIPELARYLLAEMERLANPSKYVSDKPLSAYALKPYRKHAEGSTATAKGGRKNPPMVFVHSSPRAGSTLFRVMLAGHPKLFCPPEVNLLFFENMKEWRENIGFGHEMEWTEGGLQWAFMELMGIDSNAGQALVDRFVAENTPAQEIFAKLQELSGPRLLVDKTPSYALDPETLWRSEVMFDQPKYIFLYRHPYPVMESLLRVRFDRLFGPSLFGNAEVDPHVVAETVWALCNRNLLEFFSRVEKERVLWVQYEELVRDSRPVMTRVCDFLGIPFDERVLQPYDGKRERMMGGLGDPNILQHKGIEKGLGESWKKIKWPRPLDPTTLELVARLGYEVEQAAPPPAKPAAPKAPSKEEAEKLLQNLDQLSDEQVAELLAILEADKEKA